MAPFGTLILAISLLLAVYAGCASVVGARRGWPRLVASGMFAAHAVQAATLLASGIIVYAFVSHDFSIRYVQRYSDATMPLVYKITAYWGGLDGSLLFWVFLLTTFTSIAVWRNRSRHPELIPYVVATCMGVTAFFLAMLLLVRNPFETFLGPIPATGRGLNPLLQNYWMQFHPPSLYMGFVSATIPFAFGISALVTGNLDDTWLRSVRVWTMISWFFLSMGLTLGSMWAYEVLGWGGYWGWDPVENAGFLPWLTATALLHSIMVQERRGMLKVWNVVLVVLTFLLTIFGTTMTRSGIVQSVHAFGQDNVLLAWFLIFLGILILFSVGLIIYRLPLLRSRGQMESWISREFTFVVNNWILLFAAFFILFATMFPTISESVTGERITVGPPFFNKWMVPIGLTLLALTGIAPLIAWRRATAANLKEQFAIPLTVGLVVGAVVYAAGARSEWAALGCWMICGFVFGSIMQEFWRATRVRQRRTGLDFLTSLVGLVGRSKRRYGGYLIHMAVVMLFLGWAGNAYQRDTEGTLSPGQTLSLAGFTIRYDGLDMREDLQKVMVDAKVQAFRKGSPISMPHMPGREIYKKGGDDTNITIPAISRMFSGDLYLTLAGYEPDKDIANIKAVWNPLVSWYWLGFMMLACGTLVCLFPDRAYQALSNTRPETIAGVGGASAAGATLLAISFALLFLSSRTARADDKTNAQHVVTGQLQARPPTPLEKDIFRNIVCSCPCGRISLAECQCGVADKMRAQARDLLGEGKNREQVIAAFVAEHGQQILTMPKSAIPWVLPFALGVGGLSLVALLAWRWTHHRASVAGVGGTATSAELDSSGPGKDQAADDAYARRLDDELRDLD